MATFLQYVQDVLAIFAEKDESLADLPIPLRLTADGSTTTIKDTKLGRGTSQTARYDGRRLAIMQDRAIAYGTAVTVSGSHTATITTLTVNASTSVAAGDIILVDSSEKMLVEDVVSSTSLTVIRGYLGTTAAAYTGSETVLNSIQTQSAGVDNGGFNGTDTLTFSPALSPAPLEGDDYLLFPLGLSLDTVKRAINEVIRNTDVPHLWLPSMVNDSEFAAADQATDWPEVSGSSLGTVAFDATAAHILLGERALHLIADAADEGVHSLTFRVTEGERLLFSIVARVEVGTWDVELYRETSTAAVVKSVTIDEEDFTEVRFLETVPDGAEEMRVRFTSNANLDDIYISSPVLIQSMFERTYVAPSWLTEPDRQIERAMVLPQGFASPDAADSYVALSREFERHPLPDFIRSDRFANPNRVQFRGSARGPVALLCHRTFDELDANTDTAGLDRQYVAHQAAANLARTARNPDWRTIAATSGPIARRVAQARGYGKQRLVVEERQAWM